MESNETRSLNGATRQWHVFFNALVFFTRLPAPKGIQFNTELLRESARYFPLVGMIVALILWGVLSIWLLLLPLSLALLLTMGASLLLTGGFHEDGLADCADAFGGGYSKERILTIMHDSRLGTYGVLALCMALGLKFAVLFFLLGSGASAMAVFLISHGMSRWLAVLMMSSTPYVAFGDQSKSKPMAEKITPASLAVATLFLLFLLCVALGVWGWSILFVLPLILAGVYCYLKAYFCAKIGGVNGDCLGATQQISELSIYLCLACIVHASI